MSKCKRKTRKNVKPPYPLQTTLLKEKYAIFWHITKWKKLLQLAQ
jgi:hypothetical protein